MIVHVLLLLLNKVITRFATWDVTEIETATTSITISTPTIAHIRCQEPVRLTVSATNSQ